MRVISIADKEHPGLKLWKHTAQKHNWDPVVLGLHTSSQAFGGFKNQSFGDSANHSFGHHTGHFGQKFLQLQSYLQTLNPFEWVLVTDAFDVALLDGPKVVQEKVMTLLHKTGKSVLFSAELFEGPDVQTGYSASAKQEWFPYLNSGVYAGTAGAILALLIPFSKLTKEQQIRIDDQRYYTMVLHETNLIQLDHKAEVFVSMNGVSEQEARAHSGRLMLRNGSLPSVLHFQGFHKHLLPYSELFARPDLVLQLHKGQRGSFDRLMQQVYSKLADYGSIVLPFDYADHRRMQVYACLVAIAVSTVLLIVFYTKTNGATGCVF